MHKGFTFLLALLVVHTFSTAQPQKIDSLQSLLQKHEQQDSIRVDILNELAQQIMITDSERFFQLIHEARILAKKTSYSKGLASSYRQMANYYFRNTVADSMRVYTEKSLKLCDSIPDQNGKGQSLRALAIYYFMTGNYNHALEYGYASIEVFEQIGDPVNQAVSLMNTATVYSYLHNNDKALEYYLQALEIEKEAGNRYLAATIQCNIADLYVEMGKYDHTLELLNEALEVAREYDDKALIAIILEALGNNYYLLQDYAKAESYLNESLQMCQQYSFKDVKSECLLILAKVFHQKKDYGKARQYGEESLQLTQELHSTERLNRVYEMLAELYAHTGNYQQAYHYHTAFKHLNDSLFSEKNITERANIENQYAFEKEKQIMAAEQAKKDAIQQAEMKQQKLFRNFLVLVILLLSGLALIIFNNLRAKRRVNKLLIQQKEEIEKKSNELQIVNEKLSSSNATKDKFFSIIAHDLKSPYVGIMGYAKLLLSKHTAVDVHIREEMIKLLADSATNAYKFIENLLQWAQTQTGRITFSPEALNATQIINETFVLMENRARAKNINMHNSSPLGITLQADKEQILAVLRNLISNAIKFTPDNGNILVHVRQTAQETIFSIKDDGVGMSLDKINKLFDMTEKTNTPGTNKETGTGLGLILCKEFVDMHQGKIWVESVVNQGTTFYVSIPR